MHNVAPSVALARRSRQLVQIAFVVVALGIFITVVGIALFVIEITAPNAPGYNLYNFVRSATVGIGVIVILIAIGLTIRAFTWKTDNELAGVVAQVMGRHLDDRFHFIRNVSRRELGYIDAVLVGPPGVLVLRILNRTGLLANEGADWLQQKQDGQWVPAGINPSREAIDDIKSVRDYLAKKGIPDLPHYGAVVFTQEEPALKLMSKQPVVLISHLGVLHQALQGNYLAKDRINDETVNQIVRLLYHQ